MVVNAPQVEWVASAGTMPQGAAAVIRVFGRGLAWEELSGRVRHGMSPGVVEGDEAASSDAGGGWRCASGRARQRTPSTTLVIPLRPHTDRSKSKAAGRGSKIVLAAASATCYEASFMLPAGLPLALGPLTAVLATPWGTASVPLTIVPAVLRRMVHHLDVDRDFRGTPPFVLPCFLIPRG